MGTYLKTLDLLDTACEIDETGFTDVEKVTLQSAWCIIKPKLKKHAWDIYLKVYFNYQFIMNSFRNSEGVINILIMEKHPYSLLKTLEHLIEIGLYNKGEMHFMISRVARAHDAVDAPKEHFMILLKTVNEHLKEVLNVFITPTLIVAIDKCFQIIADAANWTPEELQDYEKEKNYEKQTPRNSKKSKTASVDEVENEMNE